MIAAVGIFVVWALLSGTMAVSFQEEEMVIDASGWGGYEVKYEEVEDISYEPDGVSDGENDRRTNGFGNLKLAMGRFRNDRFGDYVRYTFNGCRACVVLEVRGETVVVTARMKRRRRRSISSWNRNAGYRGKAASPETIFRIYLTLVKTGEL